MTMASTGVAMVKIVSKAGFKPKALEYFRLVEKSGVELVVTDRGRPVVKITPYIPRETAAVKSLRRSVLRYEDPMEPVAVEDWEVQK
jgi:antitoxin (DNA-binding transcriptional repressor) of toxin-antitoxin stability system